MKITKQHDIKDCGLHVMQFFVKKYTKNDVSLSYLKLKANYGKDGISLAGLKDIASEFNLVFDTYKVEINNLFSIAKVDFPLVCLIKEDGLQHYLILEKIHRDVFYFQDSRVGTSIKIHRDQFEKIFTGYISFVYLDENKVIKNEQFVIDNKLKSLINIDSTSFVLIISALLSTLLAFGSTFFIKLVFDFVIPNNLLKTHIILFVAFLWVNFVRFSNNFFKNTLTKKLSNKTEIAIKDAFFRKIQSVSLDELNRLDRNEILKRLSYISMVADFQSTFLYIFWSELVALMISTMLLIWISYQLFLMILCVSVLSFLIKLVFNYFVEKKYAEYLNKAHVFSLNELENVYSLNSFRTKNEINYKELIRQKSMLEYKAIDYTLNNKNNLSLFVTDLVIGNLGLITVFIGVFLILKNQISIGEVVLVLTASNYFTQPISSLSGLIASKKIIDKHVDMLNFVFCLNTHELNDKGIVIEKINNICLNDIDFGYDKSNPVIKIKELMLDSNTQIFGKNGSGKSTLLNLLNYTYFSTRGKIYINENESEFINNSELKNSTLLINPHVFVQTGTVYDYLTCGKNELANILLENVQRYKLDKVMEEMNINFNSYSRDNGQNFSAGQRQLIILLKLFTKKYKLILLDEAFENLETRVFNKIKEKIKEFQSDAMFIEISHSRKYIYNNKGVDFDKVNQAN